PPPARDPAVSATARTAEQAGTQRVTLDPDAPAVEGRSGSASPLELYLERLGLHELLAIHLSDRLAGAGPTERLELAERLASLYAARIEGAATPEARARYAELGNNLLRVVPGSEAFDLRLTVLRARYIEAERVAEQHRLALASEEDRGPAIAELRELADGFVGIAEQTGRRVTSIERASRTASERGAVVQARLAESRRQRSFASFHAGWCHYYLAILEDRKQAADDALLWFAAVLNSEGSRPVLDRISASQLRFPHVARSVLGTALCNAVLGRHADAEMWLNAAEASDMLPEDVRDQLFACRVITLSERSAWTRLGTELKKRSEQQDEGGEALSVSQARLVAVSTLTSPMGRDGEARRAVLSTALASLIEAGQIGHVLDLVDRFGTLPLGSDGFVVRYVRGVRAYDEARRLHKRGEARSEQPAQRSDAQNDDAERGSVSEDGDAIGADSPSEDASTRAAYSRAIDLLRGAAAAEDAARFASEVGVARLYEAFALYYRGEFGQASVAFSDAADLAESPGDRADALWFAVIAADAAGGSASDPADAAPAKGTPAVTADRKRELAERFIATYPSDPRAARLLLHTAGASAGDPDDTVRILLEVPPGSPIFDAARREAARVLYSIFRNAPTSARPERAAAFLTVAGDIVRRLTGRLAAEPESSDAGEASADRADAIGLLRQMIAVLVQPGTPDADRAERLIAQLASIISASAGDASNDPEARDALLRDELTLRRIQVAIVRGDTGRIDELRRGFIDPEGGPRQTADRAIFRDARRQLAGDAADAELARRVIDVGLPILERSRPAAGGPWSRDALIAADSVAEAASVLWRASQDSELRELARRIDRLRIESEQATATVLRRYALLSEDAGEHRPAADAWRTLSAGVEDGDPAWFEARLGVIRATAVFDASQASDIMAQHRALFPELAPEPWRESFASLDRELSGEARSAKDEMPRSAAGSTRAAP
ncbi:MAG: hypothetical protein AAF235_06790, partial [Planctomycetota bacterium]